MTRRFSILDAMILVAATALGLGVIRTISPVYYTWPYSPIPATTWLNRLAVTLSHWAFYIAPVPAAWAWAALALRLRQPRPPLRRVMRQPGAVASVAATLVSLLGLVHFQLDYWLSQFSWHNVPFEYASYATGCAVASAWMILVLSGRWRAEPSWLDRLGCSLGIYWMSLLPLIMLRGSG